MKYRITISMKLEAKDINDAELKMSEKLETGHYNTDIVEYEDE